MDTENNKNFTFFRFEELRVYQKILDLATWTQLHSNSVNNPIQQHHLTQLNEMILQISLNISEGSTRNKNQFIYYLKVAKSCIRESLVRLTLCSQMGLFTEENKEYVRGQLIEITKMTGALITSLLKANHYEGEEDDGPVYRPGGHRHSAPDYPYQSR
ncbi:MAG: four helix bundle protein [Sphingobacteriia bacterium]|nr:four helix bundle protein [Sphingobacteriia bacterium]